MEIYQALIGVAVLLLVAAAAVAIEPSIAYSFTPALALQGTELLSPADRINLNDISVGDSSVTIRISGSILYAIADTNSMDPTIDEDSTIVAVRPASQSDLHVGDIVLYRSGSSLIIHRIIETGVDASGWYCIPKGDNNSAADGKVRFSQVEAVVVGILY